MEDMVSFIGISLKNMQKYRNMKMEKMKSNGCSSELKLCKRLPRENEKIISELLFIILEVLEKGGGVDVCDKVITSSGSPLT